jgi:serine/threonine protein kinase
MTTLVFARKVCQGSRRSRRRLRKPAKPYAESVLLPDDRFEDYVVDGVVGQGGSATVYRAHHAVEPGRSVALKVLDQHHRDAIHMDRLQREFAFANRLDHPHVVSMYQSGPGWLAMALIDGGTVSNLATMRDRLTALSDVASALDFAHSNGIVHCDVKPTNILVSQNFSRGVLIDFGVAIAVAETVGWHATRIEASLPYAAPELLRGRPPSALTDQYALACTAVELLIGKPPFSAETWMELVDAHLSRPVPSYSDKIAWVPRLFDTWLHRALAKIPESRYDSCTEMIEALSRALG